MPDDLVVCVRNVKRGKFGTEPGPTRFLAVPDGQLPDPEKHKIRKLDWFDRAQEESKSAPDDEEGDILVFVHGYNNSQDIVMQRHRQLKKDLLADHYGGTVVSYDWPSAASAINYLEDRSDAKQTALRLVTDCISVFARLQRPDCRINVHLLAHSTGAYVIREAFDDADDRPAVAARSWTVSQVALIGGDVSRNSMKRGNSKSSSLFRHSVRITNYSSSYDRALKLSNIKRVGVAPRVGRVGLPEEIPSNCVNVDCGSYWDRLDEDSATYFGDFTHSWHIGDPAFTRDLHMTIQGDIDRNDIPTRRRTPDGLVLTG